MMQTTTANMQRVPNFFTTKEECDANNHNSRPQTNLRYRGYTQTHFTCGDEEQFNQYRDFTNKAGDFSLPKENIYYSIENLYEPYDANINLDPLSVSNTFRYIFHKFKKGIFIKFVQGEMRVFLPFSKNNFENEWSDRIGLTPGYKSMIDFIQHVYVVDNRQFNPKRVNKFIKSWIGNNSIVRFEFPCSEEDTGIPAFADMFYELSKKRKIPDVEFFFNKRDFPIIKRDHTEAYDEMYGDTQPLLSHKYDKYAPILGCSTTDRHADIPCPTWDDWSRVSSVEGKFFTKSNFDYSLDNTIKWEDKVNIAVFRGSSTGSGTTIDTNPRLNVAYLSSLGIIDKNDGNIFIDAGITSWNVRPRKNANVNYLQTIEVDTLPFKLVQRITPKEQQKYKYIIHIQGHVCAYRLSLEMGMGSLILKVDSKYKIWFDPLIKPYEHYIPIKSDLSDLFEQIKWCKKNDDKCRQIAQNAVDFYNKYLTKDGILDYLQKILYEVSDRAGEYKYITKTALSIQTEREKEYIKKSYPKKIYPLNSRTITGFSRSHAILEGSRLFFNKTGRNVPKLTQEPIFKSTNTEIYSGQVAGIPVAIKNFNEIRRDECIHEVYIGLNVVNNLTRIIPNFYYMYGFNKSEDAVITEHINGITFHEYLNSNNFIFNDYISIMTQIALSLQVAQNEYSFVHWDLMPWNIVLRKFDTPQLVEYPVSNNTVIKIYSKIMPVILDYGKSHAIVDGLHVGRMNMFKFTTIQDILTILFSSMYNILTQHKLQQQTLKQLFEITTFFTGNEYKKDAFTSVVELRKFLMTEKKYSVITTSDKRDLENKTPMDFVNFLVGKKLIKIITDKKYNYMYDDGMAEFLIEDYLLSDTLDIFTNKLTAKLGLMCLDFHNLPVDQVERLYKVNEIKLTTLFFEKFTNYMRKNLDSTNIYNLIEHLKLECDKVKQTEPIIELENYNYNIEYTEDDFNFPEKIKKLLSSISHVPVYKTDPYLYYMKLRKLGLPGSYNWKQNSYTNVNTLIKYSDEIVV